MRYAWWLNISFITRVRSGFPNLAYFQKILKAKNYTNELVKYSNWLVVDRLA